MLYCCGHAAATCNSGGFGRRRDGSSSSSISSSSAVFNTYISDEHQHHPSGQDWDTERTVGFKRVRTSGGPRQVDNRPAWIR